MTTLEKLLTCEDIAAYFLVAPKTVAHWAREGRIPEEVVLKTPGGHWRFRDDAIEVIQQVVDELP